MSENMKEKFDAIVIGQRVHVMRPWRQDSGYYVDGFEGPWFVVGKGSELNLMLAKRPGEEWSVIIHAKRVAEIGGTVLPPPPPASAKTMVFKPADAAMVNAIDEYCDTFPELFPEADEPEINDDERRSHYPEDSEW